MRQNVVYVPVESRWNSELVEADLYEYTYHFGGEVVNFTYVILKEKGGGEREHSVYALAQLNPNTP